MLDLAEPGDTRPQAWARPWATAKLPARKTLRTGAWYPVVGSGPDDSLMLVLRNRTVRVPARLLEVRRDRPRKFTVVRRPKGDCNPANGTRKDLGRTYAVCPASGHRIRLFGEPSSLECPGCGYRGDVAWLETG